MRSSNDWGVHSHGYSIVRVAVPAGYHGAEPVVSLAYAVGERR
jgi:hypothetical protein